MHVHLHMVGMGSTHLYTHTLCPTFTYSWQGSHLLILPHRLKFKVPDTVPLSAVRREIGYCMQTHFCQTLLPGDCCVCYFILRNLAAFRICKKCARLSCAFSPQFKQQACLSLRLLSVKQYHFPFDACFHTCGNKVSLFCGGRKTDIIIVDY